MLHVIAKLKWSSETLLSLRIEVFHVVSIHTLIAEHCKRMSGHQERAASIPVQLAELVHRLHFCDRSRQRGQYAHALSLKGHL